MENDAFYVILWKMTHFNPTMENDTMENAATFFIFSEREDALPDRTLSAYGAIDY